MYPHVVYRLSDGTFVRLPIGSEHPEGSKPFPKNITPVAKEKPVHTGNVITVPFKRKPQ